MTDQTARWQLHRGGIVNVWQYAAEEFDLSGGRVIFQGTNGSGKSRTLELLLPLCLDGDLRYLGSKGYDTVSMRRLMLDDYVGGPNRVGYAWIELRRTVGGTVEHLTAGVGIKASVSSQQIADSWRFVTSQRVGHELELVVDDTPLSAAQLQDAVGSACIYEDEPFRDTIAELVYGMPATRYTDLLHLQRTLRNPDVGLKVLEGQLEQILSDALPPLDRKVVEQLGQSFEDLDSIRDNIKSLSAADEAMRKFLTTYGGYVLGMLRELGRKSRQAQENLGTARADLRRLLQQRDNETADAEKLAATVRESEARAEALGDMIEDLVTSPAYGSVNELDDKKAAVSNAHQAAVNVLRQLQARREWTDQLVDAALTALERLVDDTTRGATLAEGLRDDMREAGLDPQLGPAVPEWGEFSATDGHTLGRNSDDPDDEPVLISYRILPEFDAVSAVDLLGQVTARLDELRPTLTQRCALTTSLRQRAEQLGTEHQKIERLREQAEDAQRIATEASDEHDRALQEVETTARSWLQETAHWCGGGPLANLAEPPLELSLPTLDDLIEDRDAAANAGQRARNWMRGQLTSLQGEVARAQRGVDAVAEKISLTEKELETLRAGVEPEPSLPAFSRAPRDASTGSALYRLIDFADDVDAAAKAKLESALESCGLLNAWLSNDSTIADPIRDDITIVVDDLPAAPEPTLGAVLVPAPPPDSPVPTAVVRKVLERVPLRDDTSAGLSVSSDGWWRAGVLAGAMTKPTAEFIGAGAREATRQRRISELEDALRQLAEDENRATTLLENAQQRAIEWENHIDSYPPERELFAAHRAVDTAKNIAEQTTKKAISAQKQYSTAAARHQAEKDALIADARASGLDSDVPTLHAAEAAAQNARKRIRDIAAIVTEQCPPRLEAIGQAFAEHRRALEVLSDTVSGADDACQRYATEKAEYDKRVSTLGASAEQLRREVQAMDNERTDLRERLPTLRTQARDAAIKPERTAARIESLEVKINDFVDIEKAATNRFLQALVADGVWSAAIEYPSTPPEDPADAYAIVQAASPESVSQDTVLGALQDLQSALASSHDVVPHTADDVITVTVTGTHGPQPVALAARDVAARLTEQRALLSEEYQKIFDQYMLRDLADKLAAQMSVAEDLCCRMNDTLKIAQSSQGVHVQLDWQPATSLDETMRNAVTLIRTPFAKRTQDQDEQLRQALTERIAAERDSHTGKYTEILCRALDYRTWYRFIVRVRDHGPDGAPRTRRMRQLSSGETRLISYVTLFAAASAFYDAVSTTADHAPARIVLLDEAFERLDEPTISRMLELLVDLDMDWIITWPSGWALSEKIPRMHIYNVLRPKAGHGIACIHKIWNGARLQEDSQ